MVIGGMGQDDRPMVPVVVQGAGGQEKKFSCLLWTGFAGTLLLPTEEIAALGLTQTGTRAVKFADGSGIAAATYAAPVPLAGEARDVEVLAWHGEPRLGMALIQGYRLSMRFTKSGTITLEPLTR